MKTYSEDLRQRVLKDCDAGMPTQAVAQKYSVSKAWVRRLKQRRRETGEIGPKKQRHGPVPTWVTHADKIREAVRQISRRHIGGIFRTLWIVVAPRRVGSSVADAGTDAGKKTLHAANKIAPT